MIGTRYLLALSVLGASVCSWAQESNTPETAPESAETEPKENVKRSEPVDAKTWQFEIAPYLWASGVKSTVGVGDQESVSEVDFLDALDILKFAGLVHAEASNGRWGFITDLIYMKLGEATEKRVGEGLKKINIDVKADLAQTVFELGAFRRFGNERHKIDLLGGARYFGFDTDIEIGPFGRSVDADWIDPFVGVRYSTSFSDRWGFSLRGDIGGFGVGSDLTWNATALFRYALRENMDLGFGYRYMDVDKSGDRTSFDSVTSGPLLGMSIKF